MTREPGRAPPRHAHGDLTSLAPHERLPELPVVPREKPHPLGSAHPWLRPLPPGLGPLPVLPPWAPPPHLGSAPVPPPKSGERTLFPRHRAGGAGSLLAPLPAGRRLLCPARITQRSRCLWVRRGAGGQAGRQQGAWTPKEEEKGQSQGRGGPWELKETVPWAEGTSTCGVRIPNNMLS